MEWLRELVDKKFDLDETLERCCPHSQTWARVYQALQQAAANPPDVFRLPHMTMKEILKLYEDAGAAMCATSQAENKLNLQEAPLLEMQRSYVIGRFDATAGPCQIYTELEFPELDLPRLERSVRSVVKVQPLLRATCTDEKQDGAFGPAVLLGHLLCHGLGKTSDII